MTVHRTNRILCGEFRKGKKMNLPYTDENFDRFLSEIIYGGPGERDVLGDYETFIVNRASNKTSSL